MKLTRKLFALSAIAALSFCFAGCDDDSGDSNSNTEEPAGGSCTAETPLTCQGNYKLACVNNSIKPTNCSATGQVCMNNECVAATKSDQQCTSSSFPPICEGNIAKSCGADFKVIGVDCAKLNKVCKGGNCVVEEEEEDAPQCDPANFKNECIDITQYHKCVSGILVPVSCGAGQKCDAGTCVKDDSYKVAETVIGKACSCKGNCEITVSGAELKAAMGDMTKSLGQQYIDQIGDADVITAPNYFSDQIEGCDGLVAPEGMHVGCFTTSTISFPSSIGKLIDSVNSILDLVKGIKPDLDLNGVPIDVLMTKIKTLLNDGIKFKSDNGYCLVADIDIDLDVKDATIASFVKMDEVNKLAGKINTVGTDHNKAKNAACPEGSTLLTFGVDKTSKKGSANVGFDICLKTCNADSDCGGLSCINLPRNQAEATDDKGMEAWTAKVCFDKSNIDYFKGITEDFESVLSKDK